MNRLLTNALSIQFHPISLICLGGKPPVLPALPNGPSSPAPCSVLPKISFDMKKRPQFRKCIQTRIFLSEHSEQIYSIQRSQNILRLRQLLASGATEVGQRHWGCALKLRICGAIELFTFTPKNDNPSENAWTNLSEVNMTFCSGNAADFSAQPPP